MHILRFISIFALITLYSCSSEPETERSNRNRARIIEDMNYKLSEASVILASKHVLSKQEVKEILCDYLEIYEDFTYQILTTGTLDWRKIKRSPLTEKPDMNEFIRNSSNNYNLSEQKVASLILDYKLLGYRETLLDIEYRLTDIEIEISSKNE